MNKRMPIVVHITMPIKEWRQFYWIVTIISCIYQQCQAIPPEQECPEECDCHYYRINWVTDCSDSTLNQIPTYDDGLSPNVYLLNLNNNNITKVDTFPDGIKLRSLRIADNQLTVITREGFCGLVYLLDLDLSNNKINYIEPDAFEESPGLITLDLRKNELERIEGPFLTTKSLLNLDISDCQLDYLNKFFFTDTPSLSYIDLSGNPIGEIPPGIFDRLISLHVLKLNRCKLSTLSDKIFARMEDLKTLELSDNNLKGPLDWTKIFTPLVQLEYLDMSRSGITELPDEVFERNFALRSLILAENMLKNLDLAKMLNRNFKNLILLDLSSCHMRGPLTANSFLNATNLRTLILSGNSLSAADLTVALSPLINLKKLSLKNCTLTHLPTNVFHKFANLQELDLSYNPLNNAFTELLNPLVSLIHLDMGFSNLTDISKNTFSKMSFLKTLILSGNPLKNLESGLFENLTNLKRLELKYCNLSGLNETVFHEKYSYPDLEEINLSGNPLEMPKQDSFLPRQLNRLKTLDLSQCNISFIAFNALNSFSNITELYLGGNKLTFEDETSLDFLKNLPLLEKLDLSNNQLRWITPLVFQNNVELNWLKLVGNPWECGCHIADMWEWAIIVKGDISVLVGAMKAQEDLPRVKLNKIKTLICLYDAKKTPIKANKQKQYAKILNRTWSRYVRESGCDSSRRLIPARLIGPLAPAMLLVERPIEHHVVPTWAWSSALILSFMLITVASFLVKSTLKQLRKAPP